MECRRSTKRCCVIAIPGVTSAAVAAYESPQGTSHARNKKQMTTRGTLAEVKSKVPSEEEIGHVNGIQVDSSDSSTAQGNRSPDLKRALRVAVLIPGDNT